MKASKINWVAGMRAKFSAAPLNDCMPEEYNGMVFEVLRVVPSSLSESGNKEVKIKVVENEYEKQFCWDLMDAEVELCN